MQDTFTKGHAKGNYKVQIIGNQGLYEAVGFSLWSTDMIPFRDLADFRGWPLQGQAQRGE